MNQILPFFGSAKRAPAISAWMDEHPGELGTIARHWFEVDNLELAVCTTVAVEGEC